VIMDRFAAARDGLLARQRVRADVLHARHQAELRAAGMSSAASAAVVEVRFPFRLEEPA